MDSNTLSLLIFMWVLITMLCCISSAFFGGRRWRNR